MSKIGKADLIIVPRFEGLTRQVNRALKATDTTSGGRRMGLGVSKGFSTGARSLVGSGALIGAFSSITSKAMDMISSHVGSATSRLDTLKNYPTVMHSLGVGTDEAQASIATMSDRLSNLPTRLDAMAASVQGIYAATKDYGTSLTTATDAGLAMNDMLLAGGQGTQVTTAAMEQFRQMLSKGKPDMQDWRSMLSAAPGQMDQLAKSMLGPTANATQLYYALGGGNEKTAAAAGFEWATLSMSDLLDAIIRVDSEGGAGLASFRQQAEEASGGIQTAADNFSNAWTKGIANVMDAFGRDNIVSVIDDLKSMTNDVFGDVTTVASEVAPAVSEVWSDISSGASTAYGDLKEVATSVAGVLPPFEDVRGAAKALLGDLRPLAPAALAFVAAQAGISAGVTAWDSVSSVMGRVGGLFGKAGSAAEALGERVFDGAGALGEFGGLAERAGLGATGFGGALGKVGSVLSGPWGVAIAAGVAGVTLLAGHLMEARKEQEEWNESMWAVSSATDAIKGLSSYSETVQATGEAASFSAKSVDELRDAIDRHQEAIQTSLQGAQETISTLDTAQAIISNYAGQTDLSTDAQGRLTWALQQVNEQLGLSLTASDVAAGSYEDQNGNVRDLIGSLDELIAKKQEEARVSALTASLTEAYKQQTEAAQTLTQAQDDYATKLDEHTRRLQEHNGWTEEVARGYAMVDQEVRDAKTALDRAQEAYDGTNDQVRALTDSLGAATEAASEAGDAYSSLGSGMPLVEARISKNGQTLEGLRQSLRSLGADTGQLSQLSEQDMLAIATAYDGTAASIVGALDGAGVSIDATARAAAEAAGRVRSALDGMGESGTSAADSMNMTMGDLATALSDAGVSAEQLSAVGGESFAELAASCGGSIDELVGRIAIYNATPVLDKDGNVTVDATQLTDAEGDVYVWNGTELLDKDGQAVVDATQLTDAEGNVVEWNGTELVSKSSTATVEDGSVNQATADMVTHNQTPLEFHSAVDMVNFGTVPSATAADMTYNQNPPRNFGASSRVSSNAAGPTRLNQSYNNNPPRNFSATTTINRVINNITNTIHNIVTKVTGSGSKAGGVVVGHADGGVVRGHAAGAIFTGKTWIGPSDYIGEAGAEYYDGKNIVPLTNRQYSQPFADVIAEGVSRRLGTGGGTTYVLNVDGATVNGDEHVRGLFTELLWELKGRADRYA